MASIRMAYRVMAVKNRRSRRLPQAVAALLVAIGSVVGSISGTSRLPPKFERLGPGPRAQSSCFDFSFILLWLKTRKAISFRRRVVCTCLVQASCACADAHVDTNVWLHAWNRVATHMPVRMSIYVSIPTHPAAAC